MMAEVKPWEIPDKTPRAKQPLPWEIPDAEKPPGYLEDAAKGFGSGLVQGVIGLATFPQDVGNSLGEGFGYALDRLLGYTPEQASERGAKIRSVREKMGLKPPSGKDVTAMVENNFGPLYQAQYVPGQYAQTAGQFAPGVAFAPGGILSKLASWASSSVASETGGQMTKGTDAEPYARLLGAIIGGVAPDALRRTVTPLPVSPDRGKLIDTLKNEGVGMTAGQKTGNKFLKYLESEIGGGKTASIIERQGEQFTKAAAQKAGINADRLTPDVMDQAFTEVGKTFDDLASSTPIKVDAKLQDDLLNAVTDYQSVATQPARAAEDIMSRISQLASKNNGILDGAAYKQISSDIARYSRATSDTALQEALRGLKNSLDDAVQRNLSGELLSSWKNARRQYRNLIVLENAMSKAGTAEGLLSPAQLRTATVQKQGGRNYVRGKGDFADLARAGDGVLKPLPDSGTAGRFRAQNLGTSLTTLIGAAAGSPGGVFGTLLGGMAGLSAPYAAGRALMSKPVQAYLANQLLTKRGPPLAGKAVIPLLGVTPQITGTRK